ncbi:MAG: transaldolase [Chloroflexota bacterium]|nr:transaldolase [Chloroflexota bacterium]MDE2929900.1 transaldolase [Chloroflexota bacterium]
MADRNRLVQLQDYDQSVWLDSISRGLIQSGELQSLVDNDGLRGMTSNPAIFEKAISGSDDYRDQLRALHAAGKSTTQIYEEVAVTDIQSACDVLRPVYDASDGEHGLVSLEVSPELAFDTQGTIAEVRRLWDQVGRPNLMIKIPATDEGIPAVQQMLTEGYNVNITLMFSLTDYDNVAEAYISALEARASAGQPVNRIASVASFFVSRIDTLADELLESRVEAGESRAREFLGKVAVANAKVAYQHFLDFFKSKRFAKLEAQGARVQRVLWASTSTKNPDYSDVMYVDTLIGPHTVNTLPDDTMDAFRDHGTLAQTVDTGVAEAQAVLDALVAVGVDYDAMTRQLQQEGVDKFVQPYQDLLARIEQVCAELVAAS